MKAKTLLVFALSTAVCTFAASYRFYDSAHTMGVITADGGPAQHPILLDRGRDSYTLVATATILPPYRGNVRVAVEGTPPMDYVLYPNAPAVDLSPYRHPVLRENVLYDLQPRDKVAFWVVMKPRQRGVVAPATPADTLPEQGESCHPPAEPSPGSPAGAVQASAGGSSGASGERPGGGWGGKRGESGRPQGGGAAQRLAFYDTATGRAVLTVPILYRGKAAEGKRMKPAEQSFWFRHRTAILIISLLLFLEPLALIFQVSTGDNDFCGTWCPRMFWIWRAGMTGDQFLLGLPRAFMGVALVATVLGTTFFLGRSWCSHLCPVGGATELGNRLVPRFLTLNFSSIPASPVRYGYLAVYVMAPIVGLGSLCCNYCSFATIPRLFGAAFVQAELAYFFRTYGIINLALIVLLGFLANGGRVYCNFLCPVGALDALANKLGMRFGKRFTVARHACTGCGDCTDSCPTWAIDIKDATAGIDQLSCFSCGRCQQSCPEGAISYGKGGV